jgi:hypothetical protein
MHQRARASVAVLATAFLAAGCSTTSVRTAGEHGPTATATAVKTALPKGVTSGPKPDTYYVNCQVAQCTTLPGAGPFGTTCTLPSTDEQLCGPSVGEPSAPPGVPTAAASPRVSTACLMGYVNIPAGSGVAVQDKRFQFGPPKPDTADGYRLPDYVAMRITITAVGGDFNVGSVEIVWYDASGQEISSGTADIGQLITTGQTLTFVFDESDGSDPNPPADASTCTIVSYNSTGD